MSGVDMKIVITGATGSIGQSLAEAFLREGNEVIALGRNLAKLKHLDSSPLLSTLTCNYMKQSEIDRACQYLTNEDVDVIINAASTDCGVSPVEETTIEDWLMNFQVNLFAGIQINNIVIPTMKNKHNGVILNIASSAAFSPMPWLAPYSASKAATISYTKSLSIELHRHNIRANSLGVFADSHLLRSHKEQKQKRGYYELYPKHPGNAPQASENIAPFLFLTSEDAKNITGQHIECHSSR